MKTVRALFVAPLVLFLAACVTINIYFPAAAAEDAARIIVRDVLGEQPAEEPQSEPQSMRPGMLIRFASVALDVLIPAARAAEANIDISSPAIAAIRQSMRARASKLDPHYRSDAIGLSRDGLVALRALDTVPLRERTAVQKLVADENQDRNALYREIARANGHPEWEANIRETFAKVWAEEAPKSYWYQDAAGNWRQK